MKASRVVRQREFTVQAGVGSSLTIGAEALSSKLERGGSSSQSEDVATVMAQGNALLLPTIVSLAPTCMRLESMGAVVLTMWTLGVDVERMRCSGGLAGAGKEKCSRSQGWV